MLRLSLTADKMKLFIAADGESAVDLSKDELLAAFREKFEPSQLDLAVIADLLNELKKGGALAERRIAKGRAAVPGADGKLLLLVKKFSGRAAKRSAEDQQDESLSLSELHLFDNVHKGQIVARIYPPKNGEDGVDALGKILPSKAGKPARVTLDATVRSATAAGQEFETVIAEQDGFIVEDGGKVSVSDILVIPGNLDYRFGSVHFVGAVHIRGDVAPGLSVEAEKDITIDGSVRRNSIISRKGSVTIKGHLYGGEGSHVIAAEQLNAVTVQEARIAAGRCLQVERECVESQLRIGEKIIAPKGRLFGGRLKCVQGGEVGELGNESEKGTEVEFCSAAELSPEFDKLSSGLVGHDDALKLIEMYLGPYLKGRAGVARLPRERREKLERMLEKHDALTRSKQVLTEQRTQMLAGAGLHDGAALTMLKQCHPGCRFRAGEVELKILESLKGPVAVRFDAARKVLEAQPVQAAAPAAGKSSKR